MLPLAFVRPLWSTTLRSLRMWTGAAMAATLLALGLGHGQPADVELPRLGVAAPAAAATAHPGTDIAPQAAASRERVDSDEHLVRALTDRVLPHHAGAPHRATPTDDPHSEPQWSAPGQRGPPHR